MKLLIFVFMATTVFAQNPKTAIWQWAGAPSWWYSQFDVAVTRIHDKNFIDESKRNNPNIIWLPTQDFNTAYDFYPNFPEQWYLRDSKGNKVGIHYGPGSYYVDLSDMSPKINGKRFVEAYADYLVELVAKSGADGISTDGLFYKGHLAWNMWSDVDLDRNGINDIVEHGKSWVISRWAAGVDLLIKKIRDGIGNKYFIINSGSSDTPGLGAANGFIHEYGGNVSDWVWELSYWQRVQSKSKKPWLFLQQSNPDRRDPGYKKPSKNMLSFVRFSLGKSTLLERYYTFEHVDEKSPDHYWNNYYDEFNLDIGLPVSEIIEINGIWLRYFNRGLVAVNFSGSPKVLKKEDLPYAGEFWHFAGAQDLIINKSKATNNGQKFQEVYLDGYSYKGYQDQTYITGDGVFLVSSPQTIVADIIIDNSESGTSPGQDTPRFINMTGAGRGGYSLRPGGVYSDPSYMTGEKAIYSVNIGVDGNYRLYEWHPVGSKVRIVLNEQSYERTGKGDWNLVGEFALKSKTVIELHEIADALRLEYAGGKKIVPPAPPRSLSILTN